MKHFSVNKAWTLFLDRDGVINERIPGGYVRKWNEFCFCNGVVASLSSFSSFFDCIVIVTNQQGIGKGLMTEVQLKVLHEKMLQEITDNGGRIDAIYHCPDLNTKVSNCRKPNPGMAMAAKKDFPGIDFGKSIMVGDSISDIQFGKRLGMKTVLVESKPEDLKNARLLSPIYVFLI